MTVKVHFDGKVFVPDEPIELPAGSVAEVVLMTEHAAPVRHAGNPDVDLSPVITGVDPETVRAIGQDPEFDIENS